MYSVIYTQAARKDLQKLPHDVAQKVFSAIKQIKEDPYRYVKKLKAPPTTPFYSLRVGEYRVIMTIENQQLIIFVIEIGHRSKIYRKY